MKYTKEQIEIINSEGDIKVNAVAGSGKTSTIIGYAQARPRSTMLYIAFNKTVKEEAIKKFNEKGIMNVQVETAHSLAYKAIVYKSKYKVNTSGYKISEIVDLLTIKGDADVYSKYILAAHIKKFIAYFCNSDAQRVQDLNYIDIVESDNAKVFVRKAYSFIEEQVRVLLAKMDKGEIQIIHDFYLKKFQLSNPELKYDYILFDEGQDASPAMLDIFFKQKGTKVIVGDTHQQIYSWRFAVNSLDKTNYKTYTLSTSFRFNQNIANIAMRVLDMKNNVDGLQEYDEVKISGLGKSNDKKTFAVLARTNIGLLLKAIEYIDYYDKIHFEGSIYSYTYADEGTSLYDVLNLQNGKNEYIKDKVIKDMKDMDELNEYIEQTGDVQLKSMVKIVEKYKGSISFLLKDLKNKHVDNKEEAEIIFSTIHRCKGMEYDRIELANDFITEKKIKSINEMQQKSGKSSEPEKLNEEINLLYVAVTRTKNILEIPISILPSGFRVSENINTLNS